MTRAAVWAQLLSRANNAQAGARRDRDDEGSVAETGGGLLETHVTGDHSAHPPPWLTFGGSGQNPL